MKVLSVVIVAVFAFCAFSMPAWAAENTLQFSSADRVLVIAPHPDDEAIGAAGMLQAAREAGADIRVVYLTHGESNEISSLLYQRRPLLIKSDFIQIGQIRKLEAASAMSTLGLQQDQLIFFGYPDQGTMRIWQKYWDGTKPFRSFFTRINKVIHRSDFSYGKYYKGENIIRDFEQVLVSFRPTHIFVTAPFDLHSDHRAACLYLTVALLNVSGELDERPVVHYYVVHAHGWPERKVNASLALQPPLSFNEDPRWVSFALTPEQREKKKEVLLCYKSQIAYNRDFLLSFARANELYFDDGIEKILRMPVAPADAGEAAELVTAMGYGVFGGDFYCDLSLKSAFDEMGVTAVEIFSYKKAALFSTMPKLSLRLVGSRLLARDWVSSVSTQGISYKLWKRRLLIKVPLSLLKDPEVLFVTVSTSQKDLAMDPGAWKILKIAD